MNVFQLCMNSGSAVRCAEAHFLPAERWLPRQQSAAQTSISDLSGSAERQV